MQLTSTPLSFKTSFTSRFSSSFGSKASSYSLTKSLSSSNQYIGVEMVLLALRGISSLDSETLVFGNLLDANVFKAGNISRWKFTPF